MNENLEWSAKKDIHKIFIASHLHFAITGYKHNEMIMDGLSLSITKQKDKHIFQISLGNPNINNKVYFLEVSMLFGGLELLYCCAPLIINRK